MHSEKRSQLSANTHIKNVIVRHAVSATCRRRNAGRNNPDLYVRHCRMHLYSELFTGCLPVFAMLRRGFARRCRSLSMTFLICGPWIIANNVLYINFFITTPSPVGRHPFTIPGRDLFRQLILGYQTIFDDIIICVVQFEFGAARR